MRIRISCRSISLIALLALCGCAPVAGMPEPSPPIERPAPPADAGRTCTTDADCAVKDAGSCCGVRPVCVNKDTPTFPEQVKAKCAKDGRVGTCGFLAISSCQCVAGKCEGVLQSDNGLQVQ